MKSVYGFVIEPIGDRYNNTVSIGDKELILNTEIFNHEFVNRKAKVISIPTVGETDVQVGDEVIVHHNVFRRWHDVRGDEKNSKSYFNENTYIVSEDQIFLKNQGNGWKPLNGFCFVKPTKQDNKYSVDLEHETKGVIKYTDGSFNIGDLVGFEPFSKYEFIIDGEKLYRVYSKFITIKYEYQGNEETYNPSWAQSS